MLFPCRETFVESEPIFHFLRASTILDTSDESFKAVKFGVITISFEFVIEFVVTETTPTHFLSILFKLLETILADSDFTKVGFSKTIEPFLAYLQTIDSEPVAHLITPFSSLYVEPVEKSFTVNSTGTPEYFALSHVQVALVITLPEASAIESFQEYRVVLEAPLTVPSY